ncbi:MAG: A24 family peptidase [Bacteroidales bacterium]|nr:A24 family peptidase [Bacteroidales bacterium]
MPVPNDSPPQTQVAAPEGFDRALVLSLLRIPAIALLWVLAAWGVCHLLQESNGLFVRHGHSVNLGMIVVIAFGMLLAAFIDGYAFKVPNWCTLSLVLSGWYIGILHDLGYYDLIPGLINPPADPVFCGGFLAALAGTTVGFFLLFPALFVGGMGEGDVKMTMGFGSWLGAYFGTGLGIKILFWSFAVGVIVGGVFGVVIILIRNRIRASLANTRAIGEDLRIMATEGHEPGVRRANARRKEWIRLPYGVPLCVGFLGYLYFWFMM